MENEMPITPKAGHIYVHTGNIVNWNRLKRKLTQAPIEELAQCITSTLTGWLEQVDRTELQYATSLQCIDEKFYQKLPENERDEFKVTVKIFLNTGNDEEIKEALEKVYNELGVSHLETVLVSVLDKSFESLQIVWRTLEQLVEAEKIYSIGMSDLDKPQLEQLYDWAKVKPCIDQVNLESCCVMPAELTEFAKERDIQLLTHNDPKEILTEKRFQELMAGSLTTRDSENWVPMFAARYSVLIKCRGIIKAKGYIVKATRDIKKRK